MHLEPVMRDHVVIAVATSDDGPIIRDAQSALDLLMAARYELDADRIAIPKELVADGFFVLSSGMAGDILQRFVNYQMKIAFYGDFSGYTSKPLHDFIYESNKGRDAFFVSDLEEALSKLAAAR